MKRPSRRRQTNESVRPMQAAEFIAIRIKCGLTQGELAEVLGLSAARVVGRYERSETSKVGGNRGSIPGPIAQLMRAFKAGWRPPNWPAKIKGEPEPDPAGDWREPAPPIPPRRR